MTILAPNTEALAVDVSCTRDALTVTLSDGRVVSVPLVWFPRLLDATARERSAWELIGEGVGVHWEAIDEDVSVASLLQPESFMKLPEPVLPRKNRVSRRVRRPRKAKLAGPRSQA